MDLRREGAKTGTLWIIHIESQVLLRGSKKTKYGTKNNQRGQRICPQHKRGKDERCRYCGENL